MKKELPEMADGEERSPASASENPIIAGRNLNRRIGTSSFARTNTAQ